MDRLSFSDRVKAVGLPLDRVIVIASGVLNAYGIRRAGDIDLAVEAELFTDLARREEWQRHTAEWGETYYRNGECEAWAGWTEPGENHPLYDELLPNTEVIDDVRYMTLDYVKQWKTLRARDKDLADIELINAYEETHHD